jgi:DNA-nicking Smr family endonuclease
MKRQKPPTPPPDDADDTEVFRRAVADAKPLRSPPRAEPRRVPPTPEARFSRAADVATLAESVAEGADALDLETGEHLSHAAAGVQRGVLRRLRRGLYRCDAELDLHGLTVVRARQAIDDFLREAARRGWRCVRVVHGKGLGSGPDGPVLKRHVAARLRRRAEVLAYVSARAEDGGTGALQVLLRGG